MNQTNFATLTKVGQVTRFGPDWPGQRCLAKTRRGTPCQNPAIRGRGRCKLHGGRTTGPRTPQGKARTVAALISADGETFSTDTLICSCFQRTGIWCRVRHSGF